MLKLRDKQRILDDFLVLLLFCISGNPAFTLTFPLGKIIYGLSLIIILVVTGFKVKAGALKNAALWLTFLGIIFGAQYLEFGYITLLGSLNYAVKMLCAILLASYLGERLPATALKVMTGICLVSLVFYILNLAGVRFHSPIKITTKGESLIVYTQTWTNPFKRELIFRNSGMFWEPGAFAGYIVAVLLLFANHPEQLFRQYRRHFLILTLTLLTTTSTTGYVTYLFLLLCYILKGSKNKLYAFLIIGFVAAASVFAFMKLDFLGQKIQKEFRATEGQKEEDINFSRFGSIIFDMQYILSNPVFGNGLANQTRFRYHLDMYDEEDLSAFSNGFTGSIASLGLLFMIAYLLAIGLNRTLEAKWIVILTLVLLLQGEYFLSYPFFMAFPFIHFGKKDITQGKKRRRIKLAWK